MGHTVSSQRQVADRLFEELNLYAKALRQEDLEAFRSLLGKAKKHFCAVSYTDSYNSWALILFSMLIEQEKELCELKVEK